MNYFCMIGIVAGLALTVVAAASPKEEAKDQDPSTPRGLEVRLIAKKTTYTNLVDAELLKQSAASGKYLSPPEVDLTFEIRNIAKEEMHFRVHFSIGGGGKLRPDLSLAGPGAVTMCTPKPSVLLPPIEKIEKIAPGKTYTIPIKSLGFRDDTYAAYWTSPGEYTLGASFTTEIGWRSAQQEIIQLHPCTLKALPIKLTVKAN
jgi:hypothetical protein